MLWIRLEPEATWHLVLEVGFDTELFWRLVDYCFQQAPLQRSPLEPINQTLVGQMGHRSQGKNSQPTAKIAPCQSLPPKPNAK
jgi:hypothetical protein